MRIPAIALALAMTAVPAQQVASQQRPAGNPERGRYLVENVAMCIQCHTSRDQSGDLLRAERFMGAPVPVDAPGWVKSWASNAPRIAGLPGYDEEAALLLLTTGISRNSQPLRPPMPQFRFNEQDARDIYVYLKSLR